MSATRPNLGPLTTQFKVPETCQVVIPECATCTSGWQAQTCGGNNANTRTTQDDSDCWPERKDSSATQDSLNGGGFYSPGISCPIGYATSCSATASMDGGFPFQFPLTQGETAIGCCPSGYQCRYISGEREGQACYSVAKTASFTTAQCNLGKSHNVEVFGIPATVTETVSGEATSTVISEFTIYAPLYQLNFQQTDLPASARSTSVSTGGQAGAGLSAGVRAGIGAAVGGIALSILSVASFLLLRQKHKHDRDVGMLRAKREKEKKEKEKESKGKQKEGGEACGSPGARRHGMKTGLTTMVRSSWRVIATDCDGSIFHVHVFPNYYIVA